MQRNTTADFTDYSLRVTCVLSQVSDTIQHYYCYYLLLEPLWFSVWEVRAYFNCLQIFTEHFFLFVSMKEQFSAVYNN